MVLPIPGWLISLVTFPGVIFHEYTHLKMCEWRDVPVVDVCFFQIGNPAGYVRHGEPGSFTDTFAISAAPFLLNTLASSFFFVLTFSLALPLNSVSSESPVFLIGGLFTMVFLWLAVSLGMHAIPSSTDARNIWRRARTDWKDNKLALVGLPVAAVIYILDKLRFLWSDLIYAGLILLATVTLAKELIGVVPV